MQSTVDALRIKVNEQRCSVSKINVRIADFESKGNTLAEGVRDALVVRNVNAAMPRA